MWKTKIVTDFNGLVLFEPSLLKKRYGDGLVVGTDLFSRYRTSDEGDAVIREGLIVPILAIDDAEHEVVVRFSTEDSAAVGDIVAENGVFHSMSRRTSSLLT